MIFQNVKKKQENFFYLFFITKLHLAERYFSIYGISILNDNFLVYNAKTTSFSIFKLFVRRHLSYRRLDEKYEEEEEKFFDYFNG